MIIAELNGKLPSKLKDSEDILTSNVFSFFKYSNRNWFKDYLSEIGIEISLGESEKAEFIFWPNYEDRTQPDLVVVCGKYYLLFEAKLNSDFSPKSTNSDSQIEREISMGKMSAENLYKEFVYIALTAEYYKNKTKYEKYENDKLIFIWTNWQVISSFIENKLENENLNHDKQFADDLFTLLVKKRLRSFKGLTKIRIQNKVEYKKMIFYNMKTSKFKGEFTGFLPNLQNFRKIMPYKKIYSKSFFNTLKKFNAFINQELFYIGGNHE